MSRRAVEDILGETIPKKSKKLYTKRWEDFKIYLQSDAEPTEDDYLQYMDWLKKEKKYQASTIWTIYSMLNSAHQNYYGKRLQDFRRLQTLLKSYNSDYERVCAKTFSQEQLSEFLNLPLSTPYWLARKCGVALMVSGGLRKAELVSLEIGDVQESGETYHVTIRRVKQRGEKDDQTFVVNPDFAPYIRTYLEKLREDLGDDVSGRFFKGTPEYKNKPRVFVNANMGVHQVEKFGIDIANKLGLAEADRYTSHAFRRTSATLAAEAGCSSTEMMNHFGWSSQKTATRYIDKTLRMSQNMSDRISLNQTTNQQTTHVTNVTKSPKSTIINITANEGAVVNIH